MILNKRLGVLLLLSILMIAACNDFLKENPLGDATTDVVYSTESGYEALITSCYSVLHDIAKERHLVLNGTDLFTQNLTLTDNILNDYSSDLSSDNGYISNFWDICYIGIQRCNTAIGRVNDVKGMAELRLNKRKAEAVFLRALYYFFLVQQFGDIPYRDYEVNSIETDEIRTPEADVYKNIIADLESIKDDLPMLSKQSSDERGRVSWEALRHLLSEVYLTRGWDYNGKLGGSNGDFKKAADYTDEVISNMGGLSLKPAEIYFKNGDTNGISNDDNKEVIFAFRFSSDNSFNTELGYSGTEDGNDFHGAFGITLGGLYGIKDNNSFYGIICGYNSTLFHQPTEYASKILHPEMPGFDKRYLGFYKNVITAEIEEKVTAGDYVHVGDTVVYYPGIEDGESYANGIIFRAANVLANNPHALIYTPSMYDNGTLVGGRPGCLPLWKYFEANVSNQGSGTRDIFYMRLAGTYLLSAEAHLKAGNKSKAAERYTDVRARSIDVSKNPAKIDPDARNASDITIDDILDERARELAGEYHRWFDLKRTKTLYQRVIKYNLKANKAGNLAADATGMKYYLRPIPRAEMERVTNPDFEQNEGYK